MLLRRFAMFHLANEMSDQTSIDVIFGLNSLGLFSTFETSESYLFDKFTLKRLIFNNRRSIWNDLGFGLNLIPESITVKPVF